MNRDFSAIYQLYFTPVYRYVLGLSHSPDIADEITAQTFLIALESLADYRGDGSIDGWLKRIARNRYYDLLRQQQKQLPIEAITELDSDNLSTEEVIDEQESVQQINQLIDQLDSPYREVFLLRVKQELSFREIGQLYDKTENWACVTFHRAKTTIQHQMRQNYED